MMQQQQQQLEQWLAGGNGVGGMLRPTKSAPCSPVKPLAAPAQAAMLRTHSDSFHVAHKVLVNDRDHPVRRRQPVPSEGWGFCIDNVTPL